jgi:hypothetical protein
MQAFKHRQLGTILVTGRIRKASEPPYFLEIILGADVLKPVTSSIPIWDLDNCFRLLKHRENQIIDSFYKEYVVNFTECSIVFGIRTYIPDPPLS